MFFWVVGFSDFCSLISGWLVWGWNNKLIRMMWISSCEVIFLFGSVGQHGSLEHQWPAYTAEWRVRTVFQPEENSQRSDLGLGQSWIGHSIVFFGGMGWGRGWTEKVSRCFLASIFYLGFCFQHNWTNKNRGKQKKPGFYKNKKNRFFSIINPTVFLITVGFTKAEVNDGKCMGWFPEILQYLNRWEKGASVREKNGLEDIILHSGILT